MSAKFIPFSPEPVKGQAILNFTRTLRYYGDDKVKDRLRRGMPQAKTARLFMWNLSARLSITALFDIIFR